MQTWQLLLSKFVAANPGVDPSAAVDDTFGDFEDLETGESHKAEGEAEEEEDEEMMKKKRLEAKIQLKEKFNDL
jgi:hypothetical protein